MKRVLPSGAALLLVWQTVYAQTPTQLNIVVVAGEGALNRTHEKASQPPRVRVEDQNHKPVEGATVAFTLPSSGATGEFDGGGKTTTVLTDENGMAAVRGMKLNDTAGKLEILVNAAYRGQNANAVVTQFSSSPNGTHHGSAKWIILIAAAAGGGGAAAVLASHKSSSSNSGGATGGGGALIVLTVGSSNVGAPPH
ncbi:MAG TPA: hypothetical protein VKV74_16255 [Bryobacteraceae bacterium]|nr:hypothetical protein [Bryobacteraceae bacterium]